jgi:hypothetical protein
MALTNGTNMAKLVGNAGGVVQQLLNVAQCGGKERVFVETVVLAGQANGDKIAVGRIPKGAAPVGFSLITDTSLGTSTLSIGDQNSAALFAAATTLTATNTPTSLGKQASLGVPIATAYDQNGVQGAVEDILLTVGVAALPNGGNLTVITRYTID